MDYKEEYEKLKGFIKDLYPHMTEYCQEKVEGYFPEFKETDDELMLKAIIGYIDHGQHYGVSNKDMIVWLKKQGEINKRIQEEIEKQTKQQWKPENLDEPKPTYPAEPKFKVGDWVVYKQDKIARINQVKEDSCGTQRYYIEFTNGAKADPMTCFADEKFHLWTIQDAKDGDVLVYKGEIFMIKSYTLWHKIAYHCCYAGQCFTCGIYDFLEKDSFDRVHPATKEQRDLLFSKMKEAGYEWDAEKKELKKIVQKPKIYDSMDDLIADALIEEIENSDLDDSSKHNRIFWINSHR